MVDYTPMSDGDIADHAARWMFADSTRMAREIQHSRAELARLRARLAEVEQERDRLKEYERRHCEPRITTRCPSCGHQTLFIAVGGHLTCSWLKCPEPGVEQSIMDAKAAKDAAEAELARVLAAVRRQPPANWPYPASDY